MDRRHWAHYTHGESLFILKLEMQAGFACTSGSIDDVARLFVNVSMLYSMTDIRKWELLVGEFRNSIAVGAALILRNVFVFSPKQSPHSLNITITNLVKVLPKDTVMGDGTGVGGGGMLDQEEIMKFLVEEERAKVE
ncbi:GPCR kinase [Tanacetum coccineum]